MTIEEIRAINQAAAHLDGVLALAELDRRRLARELFTIAGNPAPDPVAEDSPIAAGDRVRFRHAPEPYTVQRITEEARVCLEEFPGEFAPHLFVKLNAAMLTSEFSAAVTS